jgi:hypothetical protein
MANNETVKSRPEWMIVSLGIFSAIMIFRLTSVIMEEFYNSVDSHHEYYFLFLISSWKFIIMPAVCVAAAVIVSRYQEKILSRKGRRTNYVFLVLFIIFGLNPLSYSIQTKNLSADEIPDDSSLHISYLPVHMEFRLVVGEKEKSDQKAIDNSLDNLILSDDIIITENNIISASIEENWDNTFAVCLEVDKEGGEKMFNVTKKNIGGRLAVIVDGKILASPQIAGAVRNSFSFGAFTKRDAYVWMKRINETIKQNKK